MALWTIIPVKPFDTGKSRLAGVLDAPSRAALNRRLFEHVFEVAVTALDVARIAVVSTDRPLLARISAQRAHAVLESAARDLNAALGEATRYAVDQGADAILVLPSDLPFVAPDDIVALTAAASPGPSCVIAPDTAAQGTNALLIAPPDLAFYQFGAWSFAAHVAAARARGMTTAIVRRPGLAFDLDTPDDYRRFSERTELNATFAAPAR